VIAGQFSLDRVRLRVAEQGVALPISIQSFSRRATLFNQEAPLGGPAAMQAGRWAAMVLSAAGGHKPKELGWPPVFPWRRDEGALRKESSESPPAVIRVARIRRAVRRGGKSLGEASAWVARALLPASSRLPPPPEACATQIVVEFSSRRMLLLHECRLIRAYPVVLMRDERRTWRERIAAGLTAGGLRLRGYRIPAGRLGFTQVGNRKISMHWRDLKEVEHATAPGAQLKVRS